MKHLRLIESEDPRGKSSSIKAVLSQQKQSLAVGVQRWIRVVYFTSTPPGFCLSELSDMFHGRVEQWRDFIKILGANLEALKVVFSKKDFGGSAVRASGSSGRSAFIGTACRGLTP